MLDDRDLRFDLFALGLMGFTVFLALSLVTYSPADPLSEAIFPLNRIYSPNQSVYPLNTEIVNACGHAGASCADMLIRFFGISAYFVIACLGVVAAMLLMRRPIEGAGTRLIGWLATLVGGVTLLQMFAPSIGPTSVVGPGGYLGALGRTFLESHFATVGSLILLGSLVVGGVLLCTDYVLLHVAVFAGTAILNMTPRVQFDLSTAFRRLLARHRPKSRDRSEDLDDELDEYEYEEEEEEFDFEPVAKRRGPLVSDLSADPIPEEEGYEEEEYIEEDELEEEEVVDGDDDIAAEDADGVDAEDTSEPAAPVRPKPLKGKAKAGAEREEVIAQLEEASREYDPQDYELPPRDLLNQGEGYDATELTKEVKRKAAMLTKTFEDFNLDVKVVDIETGPVIAQYELALKRGLRLNKITGLADDIAIALRVPSVRIVAPIPGKNTVGIEVPNDKRQIVRLREVMNETTGRMRRMSIPLFLGKDVSGNPLAVDLAQMPHLLIAGRTGTGKSVCLNAIISSILMTKTPDDVRLLMIDPKMVELSGYGRLPHLMHPVVTDMRKAEAILAWACEKMDERYQLLARAGVRHISSYNQLGEEELMERLQPETEDEKKLIPRHLPFIVIVADEMADLMMTAGKEVESHIIRLAGKSRAVGIHLILATQKPTVDVITGLIKSNLPSRIAFQVASKTDSRVVLDENGADRLLGYGDMLFLSSGTSTLMRGQGTYLGDDEIDRIVDYCGSKGEQNFVRELVQLKVEDKEEGEAVELKKRDDLYEDAIEIVVREGRGSVSLLQRNLQIGYGRAARLIDFMAEDGIVGAYNGSQARDVLMTLADWQATKSSGMGQNHVVDGEVIQQTLSKVIAVPPMPRDEAFGGRFGSSPEDDELDYEGEDEAAELDDEDVEDAEDSGLDEEAEIDVEDEEEEFEEDAELEDDEEYDELEEDEEDDEVEDELDEEDVEYEEEEDEDALEEEAEYEEAEDEFDGDEYEQEDFDDKEFQAAVAAQTGLEAEDYEDVEDYEEEAEQAKQASAIKSSEKRRRRGSKSDTKPSPTRRGTGKKIVLHQSHSD